MGAGGVKVPTLNQPTLEGKQVSDLIGTNVKLNISGEDVRVTGDVKNISEPWTAFSQSDNTGHFFPILFPASCKEKDVKLSGRVNGDRTVHIDEDLMLIQRLENLDGDVLTCEKDGAVFMRVDFSKVTKLD